VKVVQHTLGSLLECTLKLWTSYRRGLCSFPGCAEGCLSFVTTRHVNGAGARE